MFLGPTPGVGFEFMFGAGKNHGFDVDVNFPIRSKDFDDQVDEMKADPEVGEVAEPLPFAVSVGYHREF